MADRHNRDIAGGRDRRRGKLGGLPPELSIVPHESRQLDADVLGGLRSAALATDRGLCAQAVQHAMDKGVARDDVADLYIPAIAREMGEDWCADNMSFATVTIGVSRLQAMLRDLGPDWAGDKRAEPAAPAILLVVLDDVHHTLGALVLGGQLRRKGLSVKLMLGAQPRDVAEHVTKVAYDAVFVSASVGETLESLRLIVDAVHGVAARFVPVVIGGTILDRASAYHVAEMTGADHATRNPTEALELCGLNTKLSSIAAAPRGT